MPLLPAKLIDTVTTSTSTNNDSNGSRTPPLRLGSNLYVLLQGTEASSNHPPRMFKAPLAATPWVSKDPGQTVMTVGGGQADHFVHTDHNDYILSSQPGGPVLVRFNTTLDKFESVFPGAGVAQELLRLVITPAGDVYSIHTKTTNNKQLYYSHGTLAGGVWSSTDVLIHDFTGGSVIDVFCVWAETDSSNRVHIIAVAETNAGAASIYYIQGSGGVFSAPALVSLAPAGNLLLRQAKLLVREDIDTLEFLSLDENIGDPYIVSGTPLSSPVWGSQVQIDPGLISIPPNSSSTACELALDGSGNPTAFWNVYDFVDDTHNEVWSSTRVAGTWSTPKLFYDAQANPPPGYVGNNGNILDSLSAVNIGGNWLLVSSMSSGPTGIGPVNSFILGSTAFKNYASAGGALANAGSYASA